VRLQKLMNTRIPSPDGGLTWDHTKLSDRDLESLAVWLTAVSWLVAKQRETIETERQVAHEESI